jgi:hypothetical protein
MIGLPTRATIITSQLPIEHWHARIGEATIADAIRDRIMQKNHRVNLTGESLRPKSKHRIDTKSGGAKQPKPGCVGAVRKAAHTICAAQLLHAAQLVTIDWNQWTRSPEYALVVLQCQQILFNMFAYATIVHICDNFRSFHESGCSTAHSIDSLVVAIEMHWNCRSITLSGSLGTLETCI